MSYRCLRRAGKSKQPSSPQGLAFSRDSKVRPPVIRGEPAKRACNPPPTTTPSPGQRLELLKSIHYINPHTHLNHLTRALKRFPYPEELMFLLRSWCLDVQYSPVN